MYGFSSTFSTVNDRPSRSVAIDRAAPFVEDEHGGGRRRAVLAEIAPLSDALAVDGQEAGVERPGIERPEDVPVRRGDEPHALALAIDDEPRRDGLHATRRQSRHDLLPEDRRDLEAVEPIEDPPGLLRVDETLVDLARLVQGPLDGVLRDLVEHHAAHGDLRVQHLLEVPGDRLALAILVRREQQLVATPSASS